MKFEYIFPSAENGKDESVLTVRNGGVLGILAPSGSGKTLLMKSFAGFERPCAGKVLFDGCPITDRNRSRVSFVPDLDFYDVGERVGSIVRLFSSLFIDFDADRAYEMLFRYGVSTADRISSLTESDSQILRLVLGSCRRADVYVLDEPLRNLTEEMKPSVKSFPIRGIFPLSLRPRARTARRGFLTMSASCRRECRA